MTLSVGNQSKVELKSSLGSSLGSSLTVLHAGNKLSDHGNAIVVELKAPPTPPMCTITIVDAHGGTVHVWTIDGGRFTKWDRGASDSSISVAAFDHDVLVAHFAAGEQPPTAGPPAPGTNQTTLRVKVKDQGSL